MKGEKEKILLVDDDPRNVRLLEGIFRADGYEVTKAHGGREALDRTDGELPDLILLDVMMPGMSGHDVCERLKSDPRTRPIPVILVTALNSLQDKVHGLDIGADDFVSKPVNRLELLAKARSLLRGKALHDELAVAKAELEKKNNELQRLEQLRDSLTQMIVHDLKNPLTAIMGNLELGLMKRDGFGEDTVRRLSRALDSSRSMMRMILDLLDIGRLEENKLPLRLEPVDLEALLNDSAAEVEGLIKAQGLELDREFPEGFPAVRADAEIISRIVGNLLSNAIKHTPKGGRVTLGLVEEADLLQFFVRDNGEGIPEEFHEMIFEKFARPQLRKHGLATDRGLGLAFCKLAVEAHGGRIRVESRPGRGSVFRVSLPRAAAG